MTNARKIITVQRSHLLGLGLILVIVVVVRLRLLLLGLLRLFGVVFLLFLCLLHLAEVLPLLREGVRLRLVVRDDDVVEDRAALDLPQIEADEAEVGVLVKRVVVLVLRVGDLLGLPEALVGRVRDALDVPVALVRRIVLHRRLPLAVLLVVPIV